MIEGYEKTGKTKIFNPGQHIVIELIPIMPKATDGIYGQILKIPQMGLVIPDEYIKMETKTIDNEIYGTYLAVVSENIVPVEASEYQIPDTDLTGYFDYGKKVLEKENENNKVLSKNL